MTNLEKLIETLQNAPIENTACFIDKSCLYSCKYCLFVGTDKCHKINHNTLKMCKIGIKQWLESEVE